jgi:hypothetical protein
MTPEPSSDQAAPPLGEVGRITNVYLDPKKAFADIAARPGWIVPVVLVIAAYLAFMYCFTTHVGWERSMRLAIVRGRPDRHCGVGAGGRRRAADGDEDDGGLAQL